jgi:hypothetical protein
MTDIPNVAALIDPDDALALWHWAWEQLESPHEHPWRSRAQVATSLLDVLAFLACELSLAGRHEWIARLPEMVRLHQGWLMHDAPPRDKCLEALADLLHHGAPVTGAVRAMTRDSDPHVRAAVARGLRVTDPDARPLLEGLLADPDRRVRTIARERLPSDQPAAWWVGTFDADPIPRLPKADDEVLAALRSVAMFVDREPRQQRDMLPRLALALPRLPTPLLFELARRFVAFDWVAPGYAPMLAELVRRPDGVPALWDMLVARLDRPHEWTHHYLILGQLCGDLGSDALEPLCRGLVQCLVERRKGSRAEDMARIVSGVLRERWPASLPGVLLLDACQALADVPELAAIVRPLLSHERVDLRSALPRLLELAEGDDDEILRALSSTAARLDPEPRHAFVVRGLASRHDGIRALALKLLATLPLDPTQGSGQDAFTRSWAEPALRRAITSEDRLCEAFCPYLRRQLRAGALELDQASDTLRAVGRLWGGLAGTERGEDMRAARLERVAAWHEGATELGPPTEEEWEAWRALRRQVIESKPKAQAPSLLLVRPAGPLHADDRAVIDWIMARWRRAWAAVRDPTDLRGAHFYETLGVHFGLDGIEDPYVLACLEEALGVIEVMDDSIVEAIERQVEALRHALRRRDGRRA